MPSKLWRTMLEEWGLSSLSLNAGFLAAEFKPADADRQAAWEMYVELLTRIATQPLPSEQGDERAALDSVYSLFPTTREVLRRNGSNCIEFTRLAVVILNQVVRPFTAKWHGRVTRDPKTLEKAKNRQEFRAEQAALQVELRKYQGALAAIAGVEDLTELPVV
jgi:hypothetical protein